MFPKNFSDFAISELAKIDIIDTNNILDSVVIKEKKTYHAIMPFLEHTTSLMKLKNL